MKKKLQPPKPPDGGELDQKADLRTFQLAALCHEAQVECLYWKSFSDAARSGKGKAVADSSLKGLRAELQQALGDARALTSRIEQVQRDLAHHRQAVEIIAPAPANRSKPAHQVAVTDREDVNFDEVAGPRQDAKAKSASRPRRRKRSPKVSIIIPLHPGIEVGSTSIERALVQSYDDVEVIVVESGVEDGLHEILASLKEKSSKLKLIRATGKTGEGAASVGLAAARGEYVLFQSVYDTLEVDAVENLVAVALARNSDIVGGALRQRLPDKDVMVPAYKENAQDIDFRQMRQKAFKYATLYDSCNKLFLRRFLNSHRVMPASRSSLYEVDLWLRSMFLVDGYSQIDKLVSTRIVSNDSRTHLRTAEEFEAAVQLVNDLIDYCHDKGLSDFAPMRNQGVLHGVMGSLVKWKLEEFDGESAGTDLVRLTTALCRLPEDDFATFYIRKSKGPMAAVMLLTRRGQYLPAKLILQKTAPTEHALLMGRNPRPAPDDLIEHALGLIGWESMPT